MDLLFWLFCLIVLLAVYVTAAFLTVRVTVDKLGARSGLFGVGLVHIVMGFAIDRLIVLNLYNYLGSDFTLLDYVMNYAFLIMGISGIVMVAVDLLKSLQDLRKYVSHINDKQPAPEKSPTPVPTWKRLQMEMEE